MRIYLKMLLRKNQKAVEFVAKCFYIAVMNRFKHFIEWHVFGVCSYLGDRMGIASSSIRKYFIYTSLLTMGSPVVFYLIYAFWINIKRYILSAKRNPLRYL